MNGATLNRVITMPLIIPNRVATTIEITTIIQVWG